MQCPQNIDNIIAACKKKYISANAFWCSTCEMAIAAQMAAAADPMHRKPSSHSGVLAAAIAAARLFTAAFPVPAAAAAGPALAMCRVRAARDRSRGAGSCAGGCSR